MKRILACLVLLVLVCGMSGCSRKVRVVTTLFPLYDFARSIGGSRAEVTLLIPPGVEPHSFTPSSADIEKIAGCDIFIFTGNGMEQWVAHVLASIDTSAITVIDASSVAAGRIIPGSTADADRKAVNHAGPDPHIWLDFSIDTLIVNRILAALCERDRQGEYYFNSNATVYRTRLVQLDRKYRETIARCGYRTILHTGHFAFGYLCARYGLTLYSPYRDFSPYPEPSSQGIAQLNLKLGVTGINYIFYEELLEPKIASVVCEETGAKMLLLHAAHNVTQKELDSGIDFITIMDDNLERLKTGLEYR